MHQIMQRFGAGHRLLGGQPTDLRQAAAEEAEGTPARTRQVVLIDGDGNVLGNLAQAGVRLLEQADVLPDAGVDRRAIGREFGRRVDLAANPAQRFVRQVDSILVLPCLTLHRSHPGTTHDALTIIVADLPGNHAGIGENGLARMPGDLAHTVAEKGVANTAQADLALENGGGNGIGNVAQTRFGGPNGGFLCFPLGNVDDGTQEPGNAAIRPRQRRLVVDGVAPPAVADLDLRLIDLLSGGRQELPVPLGVQRRLFGRQQVGNGSSQPLATPDTEEILTGLVELQVASGSVLEVNRQRQDFEQLLDEVQLLMQLLERQPPFGHIVERTGDAGEAPAIVELRARKDLQPAATPVARPIARFLADGRDLLPGQGSETRRGVAPVCRRDTLQRRPPEAVLNGEAGNFGPGRIQVGPAAIGIGAEDDFLEALDNRPEATLAVGEFTFDPFAFADVGADGDVLQRLPALIAEGNDAGVDPVKTAFPASIAELAMPHLASRNHGPHLRKQIRRVHPRLDDPVVASEQFVARVAADLAEPVVGVGNRPVHIGDADDGMLVQSELLVGQREQRALQVPLTRLALAYQVGHQYGKGFEIVSRRQARLAAAEQPTGGAAQ